MAPRRPLSPWQLFYGAAHRLRRGWFASRAARLPVPVISVGNLHWGGTGKTPMVAAVARHLAENGSRVAILSRGYGRRGTGIHVVSTGDGPILGPRFAGDEPVALAAELPGVAIVVGNDRYLAGLHAIERLAERPDCFVLDDGFSHLRLERDLDILVLPAHDPFGGGRLLPFGRLREPLSSVRHAAAVVLSGAEAPEPDSHEERRGTQLAVALAPFGFRGPGFSSRTIALDVQTERRRPLPVDAPVFLVSGIANPERFVKSVEALPLEVAGAHAFGDHHRYRDQDVTSVQDAARASGAEWILTTTKDYVKLLGRLEIPLAHLPIRAEPEPAFWNWLDGRLLGPS